MPELSYYSRLEEDELDPTSEVMLGEPELTRNSDEFKADPTIFDRMQQRYKDSMGFADPARTLPGWLLHHMNQNIPREELDKKSVFGRPVGEPEEAFPGMYMRHYEMSEPLTFRQIMEMLKQLQPNERQNP